MVINISSKNLAEKFADDHRQKKKTKKKEK